jgi:hypothetical protein
MRPSIRLVALPLLLASACADPGPDGDLEGEVIESVSSAITLQTNTLDENGFKTDYNAQVAIGGATDHVLPVWVGKDSAGKPQIVGESFFNKDGTPFGDVPRQLHPYSTGTNPKSWPAAAFDDSGNNTILVVWQDDYSATDSDIWGAMVNDQGKLMPRPGGAANPFHINFDGDSEKTPWVTYVRDQGMFLVTYTRKSSAGTALSAQWVDANGSAFGFFDLISSGVSQTASRPTTAYARNSFTMLVTWNNNQFAFFDVVSPLGIVGNTITGNNVQGLVAAASTAPSVGKYALAWRDGDNGTSSVKTRVFSKGCFGLACAGAATSQISAGGAVTNVHQPALAAAGLGFAVYAGTEETPWRIRYAAFGGASGTSTGVTPDCAGAQVSVGGHQLGSSGGVIAATGIPNVLEKTDVQSFLMYDSFCGTPASNPKELVSRVNPTNASDILNFNVSTNGQ